MSILTLGTLWTWLAEPRQGLTLLWMILGGLVVGIIALALITGIPPRYRKGLVVFITFICGLFFAMEFLAPIRVGGSYVLTNAVPTIAQIEIVVGSFALLVGIYNLFQIHGKAVAKRNKGWYNSAAFFFGFFSIMILGFMRDAGNAQAAGLFGILFQGFLIPLQATTFSLVAFYIVSAAYRAFRIKSAEAVLMMVAAAIVMLALVPIGAILTSWLPSTGFWSSFRLEKMGYWLITSPNMAVQRAIAFGIAVGWMATGLRIWLSLERGSFFDRQL